MAYDKPVWRWVNGEWLVFVPGKKEKIGTEVIVHKKSGSQSYVILSEYVTRGDDGHLYRGEENARKSRAATTKLVGLNKDSQTAEFEGSDGEIYKTSLHSCSCPDFEDRGLPCKHIYRLGAELGINIESPKDAHVIPSPVATKLRKTDATAEEVFVNPPKKKKGASGVKAPESKESRGKVGILTKILRAFLVVWILVWTIFTAAMLTMEELELAPVVMGGILILVGAVLLFRTRKKKRMP